MKRRGGLLLLVLVCALVCVSGYFFFVLTHAGQASDDAGYFGRITVPPALARIDGELLAQVRVPVIAGAGLLFLVLGAILRRPLAAVCAALAMGAAIEGAEQFKDHLPRPGLVEASGLEPGYFRTDTYPSGHTSTGASFFLGLLLITPPRFRRFAAPLAGLGMAAFATAVFFLGWHRPSDAIGGLAWTGLCFGAAALVLSFSKHPSGTSGGLRVSPAAGVVCVVTLIAAGVGAVMLPGVVIFCLFTASVVSGAFALAMAFGGSAARAGV